MFISFEGIEGVGKTTAVRYLDSLLTSQSIPHIVTREPGGTPLAENIRHLLLATDTPETVAPDTELLLMFAARAQHLHQIILPALAGQKWVVCDRFTDASYAYQGGGRGMNTDRIQMLEDQFVVRKPDLTFWLDAPVELALERTRQRGERDRFEQEKAEFFVRARASYQQRYEREPHRIVRIDASCPESDVAGQITEILQPHF